MKEMKLYDLLIQALEKVGPTDAKYVIDNYQENEDQDESDEWWNRYYRVAGPICDPREYINNYRTRFAKQFDKQMQDLYDDIDSHWNEKTFLKHYNCCNIIPQWKLIKQLISIIVKIGY